MGTVMFEHTDTFGGEANYSWVSRKTIEYDEKKSNLAYVRMAKKEFGLNGIRSKTYDHGDMIEIRPNGLCQVIFINFSF